MTEQQLGGFVLAVAVFALLSALGLLVLFAKTGDNVRAKQTKRLFVMFFLAAIVGYIGIVARIFAPLWLSVLFTNIFFVLPYYLVYMALSIRKTGTAVPLQANIYFLMNLLFIAVVQVGLLTLYGEFHIPRMYMNILNLFVISLSFWRVVFLNPAEKKNRELVFFFGFLANTTVAAATITTVVVLDLSQAYLSISSMLASTLGVIIYSGIMLNLMLSDLSDEHYRQSITDSMTGLFNRRYFFRQAENRVSESRRHDSSLSVIMCDIDHFKSINDRHGHHIGDQAIIAFAAALRDAARQEDIVARIGGEEFVLMLPQTRLDKAALLAERIREQTSAIAIQTNQGPVTFTASFGVSTLGPDTESAQALLSGADAALYTAKEAGRNQVVSRGQLAPA